MGLFGRRKKDKTAEAGGDDARAQATRQEAEGAQQPRAGSSQDAGEAAPQGAAQQVEPGPWDVSAPLVSDIPRVSFGTLFLPVVQGMQVSTPKTPDGVIPLIEVGVADTVMQLALLATARSGGLWEQVLPELTEQLVANGYTPTRVSTDSGVALLAKPAQPGDGQMDMLMEGFQGKGWLLRVIFRGAAATDAAKQQPLRQMISHAIVDRGEGFYAPGDIIPMREPRGPAQEPDQAATPESAEDEGAAEKSRD